MFVKQELYQLSHAPHLPLNMNFFVFVCVNACHMYTGIHRGSLETVVNNGSLELLDPPEEQQVLLSTEP